MRTLAALLGLAAVTAPAHATDPVDTMRRIRDPQAGLIVIAHRGCHQPAPHHGLPSAPENSARALDHCATLGVDVMETDVRKTRDGHLVIMHDATVDRTTDGKGAVAQLTLAQLKALHLRANEGGAEAAPTDQSVLTLAEMLALAKGRIVLNLDVKDAIYAEVIDMAVRLGAADRVIVKVSAGTGSAPLAAMAPFDRVPFMPMIASGDGTGTDLPAVVDRQASGARRPIGYELPRTPAAAVPAIVARVRATGGRLWVNSLWDGFIAGVGGDVDALRDPDAVWGRLYRSGITMIQTDEPEALLRYHAAGSTRK
ncbi:glycerophosphodiester phosphodiesterase family protein [Sphingomonas sp. 2R-10]|uniref:glycerophosphodiester phosphodiesterase family protein n=1 Tax=Sphingomonas sp. 2R-10 TaxID=3045148 RepID=UPI000F7A9144|nr:glycerophosphodiester phosphodiesterase family protein [Sphingomonas sp. 2R-10]MDJ0278043.1 glycerophosphodiester phosphodiesterase family protein [Sphingomonas sp. 2R-10]